MNFASNGLLFSNILPYFLETLVKFSDFMTKPLVTVLRELSKTWDIIITLLEKILDAAGGSPIIEELINMPVGVLLFGTGLLLVLVISLVRWLLPIV